MAALDSKSLAKDQLFVEMCHLKGMFDWLFDGLFDWLFVFLFRLFLMTVERCLQSIVDGIAGIQVIAGEASEEVVKPP